MLKMILDRESRRYKPKPSSARAGIWQLMEGLLTRALDLLLAATSHGRHPVRPFKKPLPIAVLHRSTLTRLDRAQAHQRRQRDPSRD